MTDPRVRRLRELHDKAKRKSLPDTDRKEYEQLRSELGRLMVIAQHMSKQGKTLRSELRVAQIVKVVIDPEGVMPERTTTIDLASGGFAALLGTGRSIGKRVDFVLELPAAGGGKRSVAGKARVASSRPQGPLFRVSFAIEHMEPDAREHFEISLLDFVLARFAG